MASIKTCIDGLAVIANISQLLHTINTSLFRKAMGWQLEIFKMAFYMSFPVGCFYYFNQPAYFEEWVIKTKREIYPPIPEEDRNAFVEVKMKMEEIYERKAMEAFEAKQKNKSS